MPSPQYRKGANPSHSAHSSKKTPHDFQGMAGRHEAANLASSFTGLVAFVAKGAKHYAIMSTDPQFSSEQQQRFKSVSQQYRRVANETMQTIEACIGRSLFENPYVAERLSRGERATLLCEFNSQPAQQTRGIFEDLQAAEGLVEAPPVAANPEVFQPSSSLQKSPVSAVAARIGGFFGFKRTP